MLQIQWETAETRSSPGNLDRPQEGTAEQEENISKSQELSERGNIMMNLTNLVFELSIVSIYGALVWWIATNSVQDNEDEEESQKPS